jgi:hypothetical protein
MADKLNYQQARQIRKTKFSDLFLDTLAQKETGVIGSVGKAISLRSQARIKGIKEKFDPLNIVKFLTFGSKLGPALYGKMAGRDQKDIDYFTGRSRHVTGGKNTADKIKGKGGGDEGINEQLAKIFTFLKSSREDDVKLKEQAKNSEEEINMEKDRRHKELVKTLEKLMKQIGGGGTATATKEEGRGFLDGIMNMIRGLTDQIQEIIGSFSGMSLIRGLAAWAPRLISFIASPAGLITGIVIAAGFITYEALQKQQKNLDEAAKTGDVGKTSIEAARTLDFMNPEGALVNPNLADDTLELTLQSLKDAGTPESIKAAEELKVEIDKKKSTSTATKVTIPEAPAGMEFDAEGGLISAPTNIKPKPAPVVPVNKPQPPANMEFDADGGLIKSPAPKKLEPVSSPSSAPVSSLSNTNVQLNLPSDNSGNSMAAAARNSITAMNSRNKGRSGLMPSQISVRNEEPTYNELIAASTRMI